MAEWKKVLMDDEQTYKHTQEIKGGRLEIFECGHSGWSSAQFVSDKGVPTDINLDSKSVRLFKVACAEFHGEQNITV